MYHVLKMNSENIIICGICLAAIAIVGYLMYTKISDQNQEINSISKRFDAIEMMLARPPPPDDLHAMYSPPSASNERRVTARSPPPCESAMCNLEPLHIESNEEELNNIVDAELNNIVADSTKTSNPKLNT